MKEILRRYCPQWLHTAYAETKFWIRFHFFRKGLISEMFRGLLGYEMNWDNPQDMDEKIQWMKLYYETTEWTLLADKYRVREYVKERVGQEILPRLYGVYSNVGSIDFTKFPNKFVLKANNGQGTVYLVKNKAEMDIKEVRKILNKWLHIRYGYKTVEPHYLKIKPLIIAEEYLEDNTSFSTSLVDYKVFCFGGKPYCILVCTDRVIGEDAQFFYFDCEWNIIPDFTTEKYQVCEKDIPKPYCLSQLLDYAERLSKGHPLARVDFYIVNGKIYFGEMTMTPKGGYNFNKTREQKLRMGKLIKLPVDK